MNAAAKAFSLPFVPQKEVGFGAKPQCTSIKTKEQNTAKPILKLVKNLSQQPKQAKPHFGKQEQL